LYIMNADGSGLRQIARSGDQPHWSRDGRLIAFVDQDGTVGRVVVVRGDGSRRRVLGSAISPDLSAPEPWSPGDRRIAWGGCGGLCVSDLGSLRRTRIPLGGRDDFEGFSWSPDGRELAAVDQSHGLVVVNLAGKQLTVLSKKGTYPAWRRTVDGSRFSPAASLSSYRLPAEVRALSRDTLPPLRGGRPMGTACSTPTLFATSAPASACWTS
jgi:hypothetical protein